MKTLGRQPQARMITDLVPSFPPSSRSSLPCFSIGEEARWLQRQRQKPTPITVEILCLRRATGCQCDAIIRK